MPAPGDQHNGAITNPFEERVVDGFSATEIATLQSRLNRQLGPEYISQRPGNGGGRVAYLEGNKAIALANEVFGFNGWSSSMGQVQIDYVDENPQGKVSLGLSIVVRITLKGGTYHEDIGYGSIENGRGKAAAFEKAKKEAATDGLKRALRTFGNVLGNCLYDKEYLKKVQTMKVKPVKFDEENLHRHPDFAPRIKEESAMVKREADQTPSRSNGGPNTRTEQLDWTVVGEFDDDEDENLFNGVEASGRHGVGPSVGPHTASRGSTRLSSPSKTGSSRIEPLANASAPGPQARPQAAPAMRDLVSDQNTGSLHQPIQAPGRPLSGPPAAPQPQIQQTSASRPDTTKGPSPRHHTTETHSVSRIAPAQPLAPNLQPFGPTPPQIQNVQPAQAVTPIATTAVPQPPADHRPPVGFVTSRAAELLQNSDASASLNHLPAFNPNADSPVPKEQRTPGIDHTRSVPTKRHDLGAVPPPAVPSAGATALTNGSRPGMGTRASSNFANPGTDLGRRIGMPPSFGGAGAMSPSINRGAYKPPMKRPPLQDVSNQVNNAAAAAAAGGEPDAKRQKMMDGQGVENMQGVTGVS